MMPSMPGSGTAVPPVDDEVVLPPDVLPPEVLPPEVLPPDLLPPELDEVLPPDVLPPEVDEVEVPPHELDVVEDVDVLDDDELDPCLLPQPPLEPDHPPDEEPLLEPPQPLHDPPEVGILAWAGVTSNRPTRTLAIVALCFMGLPLQARGPIRATPDLWLSPNEAQGVPTKKMQQSRWLIGVNCLALCKERQRFRLNLAQNHAPRARVFSHCAGSAPHRS
jgi:hypothetical protein